MMQSDVEVSLRAALKDVPVEAHEIVTQAIVNFLKHYNNVSSSSIAYVPNMVWCLVDIMADKEE